MLFIVMLCKNTTSQSYKLELQELKMGILPANTNIDAITYNGNLGFRE
jgi:hypothetical protein